MQWSELQLSTTIVTSMALLINILHKFLTTTRQIDNIKFSYISYSRETRIVFIKNKSQLIPEYTFFQTTSRQWLGMFHNQRIVFRKYLQEHEYVEAIWLNLACLDP